MTKIRKKSAYPIKQMPEPTDYMVGTDSETGETISFEIQSIINSVNGSNGKNNVQYRFSDGTNPSIEYTTEGYFFTDNNNIEIGTFTKLIINKKNISYFDLSELFQYLGSRSDVTIKIENPSNPNNFFSFQVNSSEEETDYFIFTVQPLSNLYLGKLENEMVYSFYFGVLSDLTLYTPNGGFMGTAQDIVDSVNDVIYQVDTLDDRVDEIELDLIEKLDKGTYTGNAGNLKTDIDNIYQADILINYTAPTRSVNTFTFPMSGYTALINKVQYTNTSSFVTTINPATTDYKRTDLIYITTGGIISKKIGIESITVAERPSLNTGEVGIAFINVFGNVIETPTPITQEISIQNAQGVEQFTITDYIRFENTSFNISGKRVVVEGLTPLSVFIDVVNGNDSTAVLESYKKPYKTFEAAMNALPAYNEETYTIFFFGGTIPILRRINIRNFDLVGIKSTTLDFTNCKEDDGVTQAVDILRKLHYFTDTYWNFRGFNISILNTYTGNASFKYGNTVNDTIHVLGYVNNFNWQCVQIQNVGGFNTNSKSNFIINSVSDVGTNTRLLSCLGSILINIFISSRPTSIFHVAGNVEIKSITKANTGTNGNVTTSTGSGGSYVDYCKIGNIDINRTFLPNGAVIEFNNSNINTTRIALGNMELVTGRILSGTGVVDASSYIRNVVLRNFSGKLGVADHHVNGATTFEDCFITVDGALVTRSNATQPSVIQQCVTFKGNNTIVQTNTAIDLFANAALPIDIIIQGQVSTNAVSFGQYASYTQVTSTFKEKNKEIIIRSKKDLVNKVLDSMTTYVIDGVITLLTGEFIQVPIGGLTINGYGFTPSVIQKNVSGQSIFSSPVGGSGDFVSLNITYQPGAGSVFNLIDSNGTHAIELDKVNFQGSTGSSLGILNGYRQGTGITCGLYNLSDGFTFEGNWSGWKFTNSNIIGFASTGTLFKKGSSLVFSNRFYAELNIQVATGSKICDFDETNFTNNKSLQIVNSYAKVNGVIDPNTTGITFPNILPTSSKAYFLNNIGIKNSFITPYGISSANMLTYADDTAAAAGGIIQIGDTYFETSTGYLKKRII